MRRTFILALLVSLTACSSIPTEFLGPWQSPTEGIISVRASSSDELILLRFYDDGRLMAFEKAGDAWQNSNGQILAFGSDGLSLSDQNGLITATRVAVDEHWASVETDGANLNARLMLPRGEGPFPTVVLVHGSGDDAATRSYPTADFFAANDIASITFDKRGTGESTGRYNFDFYQLADDVLAVVEWAGTQPDVDPQRIGLSGYSQGGWIAPLAASKSSTVAFVVVNYGMIDAPSQEELIETVATMERRGFSGEALDKVAALSKATIPIMDSNFKEGWDDFNRLIAEYEGEPFMARLEGTTPGEIMQYPNWVVKIAGPFLSTPGLPWEYNSITALDELATRDVPSAWLIADRDRSAPNEFTLSELARRQDAGEPVTLHVFEDTDHGIRLISDEDENGQRSYGGYHPEYFSTEVAEIKRLAGVR